MSELLSEVQHLVRELRNGREADANWPAFERLVRDRQSEIVSAFSLKWLRSICDTFADFGEPAERRDALTISLFINMVRFAETQRYLRGPILADRLAASKIRRVPLYEELFTFSIDRQDVFLNLSKRMARQLAGTGLMEAIWREVLRRLLAGDNVLTEMRGLSAMPERYFPLDPLGIADNYGVTDISRA